jgi:hypothetical protein
MGDKIMEWTLHKPGQPASTFAELGILWPRLRLGRSAADRLTFRIRGGEKIGAFAMAKDETAIIRRGGGILFQRHLTRKEINGYGRAYEVKYTLSGPWDFLERFFFARQAAPQSAPSVRVLLNVKTSGVAVRFLTTREQITGLLRYVLQRMEAQHLPAPFTIGEILVGSDVKPPVEETKYRKVADLIRDQLAHHPGAVVHFDYQTVPPTLHILAASQ